MSPTPRTPTRTLTPPFAASPKAKRVNTRVDAVPQAPTGPPHALTAEELTAGLNLVKAQMDQDRLWMDEVEIGD